MLQFKLDFDKMVLQRNNQLSLLWAQKGRNGAGVKVSLREEFQEMGLKHKILKERRGKGHPSRKNRAAGKCKALLGSCKWAERIWGQSGKSGSRWAELGPRWDALNRQTRVSGVDSINNGKPLSTCVCVHVCACVCECVCVSVCKALSSSRGGWGCGDQLWGKQGLW